MSFYNRSMDITITVSCVFRSAKKIVKKTKRYRLKITFLPFIFLYYRQQFPTLFIDRSCLFIKCVPSLSENIFINFHVSCWKRNVEMLGSLSWNRFYYKSRVQAWNIERPNRIFQIYFPTTIVFQIYFHSDSYRVIVKNFYVTKTNTALLLYYIYYISWLSEKPIHEF